MKTKSPFSSSLVLLFYLPLLNIAFIAAVLLITDRFSWALLSHVFARVWMSCFLAYLLASLVDKVNQRARLFEPETLRYFSFKYSMIALAALVVFFALIPAIPQPNHAVNAMPIGLPVIVGLQLIAAIAIRYAFAQQKQQIYLKTQYQLAQYSALKAQLNPHFLFNSLNLLSAEIKDNPEIATEIVDELSELLRNVLSQASSLSVPFGQDLDWLEHYLFIQKLRFEERVDVKLFIDDGCRNVKVPPLILQPIIENCFVHGFGKENENLSIEIKAALVEDKLVISVKDDGAGFVVKGAQQGRGLTIAQDSLTLLYGDQAQFTIHSEKEQGTWVDIVIPNNKDKERNKDNRNG